MDIYLILNILFTIALLFIPLTGNILKKGNYKWYNKIKTWRFGLLLFCSVASGFILYASSEETKREKKESENTLKSTYKLGYLYYKEKDSINLINILASKDTTIAMLARYGLKIDSTNNTIENNIFLSSSDIFPYIEINSDSAFWAIAYNTSKEPAFSVELFIWLFTVKDGKYEFLFTEDVFFGSKPTIGADTHESTGVIMKSDSFNHDTLFVGLDAIWTDAKDHHIRPSRKFYMIDVKRKKADPYKYQLVRQLDMCTEKAGYFKKIKRR